MNKIENPKYLAFPPGYEKLDAEVNNQNYDVAIDLLKKQKNDPVKLEWLRKKVEELHAPLYFALALLEFDLSPTLETAVKVSMPLLKTGSFRILQDCRCFEDQSLESLEKELETKYENALDKKIAEKIPATDKTMRVTRALHVFAHTKEKTYKTAKRTLEIDPPSPAWILAGRNKKNIPMPSEDTVRYARHAFAYETFCLLKEDVLSFCRVRLKKEIVNQIIKKNTGPRADFFDNLAHQHYVTSLKEIWCERDRAKRLKLLRSISQEMHAPFLFELGLAEFAANPTIETLHKISYPYLKAGYIRLQQDFLCFDEPDVKNLPLEFEAIYEEALRDLVFKHLGKPTSALFDSRSPDYRQALKLHLMNILQKSEANNLPLATWVLGSIGKPGLFPPVGFLEKCRESRLEIIQDAIAHFEKREEDKSEPYTKVFEEMD